MYSPLYHNGTFGLDDFICLAFMTVIVVVVLYLYRQGSEDKEDSETGTPDSIQPDEKSRRTAP
jgi:hypothetical protein